MRLWEISRVNLRSIDITSRGTRYRETPGNVDYQHCKQILLAYILEYIRDCKNSVRRRTTYIYVALWSALKSRTTYIYVASSVTNFGAILFTPYMHGEVFCVAVDS